MTLALDAADAAPRERILPTPALPGRLLLKIWDKVGFVPHDLQRAVLLNGSRNQLISAGRRAGKSRTGGMKLVPEIFRAAAELKVLKEKGLRREYWIVGPEYSDAEKEFRVFWDACERLGFKMDKPGSYNNPLSGEMRVQLFGGRFVVHAKSAKYPGTLVGEGLSGVVYSEAAKLKPSVHDKFIRPTLADFGGWAFFGSTPEGRNWFYDYWVTGQDTRRPDWASWRVPSWVNPYVYPRGVEEALLKRLMTAKKQKKLDQMLAILQAGPQNAAGGMRPTEVGLVPYGIDEEIWALFLDMSLEMFGQEVAAEFTEYLGRVFKDWDEAIHLSSTEFRRSWQTFACVDWGFTNPLVWLLLQIDPHREQVHVIHEYYETQRTTREAAQEIRDRGLAPTSGDARVLAFYPDPAEPDRTREFEAELQIASRGGTGGDLQDRLEWIRRFLKYHLAHLPLGHPERVPKMTVHPRCTNLRREMSLYKYKETAEQADAKNRSAPEEPLAKDNHTPEALGRFFRGFFGKPTRRTSGANVVTTVGR
jgi:hypothetical protein